jgi:CRP/FNR family transcriptional regulator, dissimilatory nitrate respiration regulator
VIQSDWLSAAVRASAIDRRLTTGETLFRTGFKTVGLFEVISGKVRLVRVDRSGREAVLQVASSGETLAEASLFSAAYHCDAIAATEALVRLYPKKVLLKELERDPKLARAFTARLAQQVMALRTRLEQRNILSARERIRHFFTLNLGVDGQTVELSGTLKELAADLGLTHEALYRTLADMEKDNEIRRVGGKIIIQKYDQNHMPDGE